jgi:hypothetical protein
MKGHPDINDTLRDEGTEGVRRRHDRAKRFNNGKPADAAGPGAQHEQKQGQGANGNAAPGAQANGGGAAGPGAQQTNSNTAGPGAQQKQHTNSNTAGQKQQQRATGGAANTPRFHLIAFRDILLNTAPAYLVKGIIPLGGLIVVWGAPKCGKSFWVFDLAMHVALGREYRGRRVQQGAVVYLALEGGRGFRNRVEAWRQRHLRGHLGDVPFYLIDVPVDLAADRAALIDAIRQQLGGQMPAVVVVDTLNRALNGGENKPEDMSKFIRAADAIRTAFACAAIVVHHCGVDDSRPRGHTSLPGADDAQIAVSRDAAGNIVAEVEHMKDGEDGALIASQLEVVDLGTDQDGDRITSCVVVEAQGPLGAQAKARAHTNANQKRFLDILRIAISEAPADTRNTATVPFGVRAVTRDMLRRYCVTKGWLDEGSGGEKELSRARAKLSDMLNALAGKNLIGLTKDHVWMP